MKEERFADYAPSETMAQFGARSCMTAISTRSGRFRLLR